MAQVKFYSKSTLPTSSINDDGVYFINGGELYKGAQRFGLARVTADADPSTNLTTAARGDINVYEGTATVFDGNSWIALTDGALAAKVSAIETVVSVVTTQEGQEPVTTKTVTADTGYFTNLTVSDTATFSVTTVSASSLTVGGSTINQIAQAEITAATLTGSISNSQGTSLVTEGQVVNYVSAAVTNLGNVMHFEGTTADLASISTPKNGDIYVIGGGQAAADYGWVDANGKAWASTTTAETEGWTDVSTYATKLTSGKEYIYIAEEPTGRWELIGDQNAYATAATVSALAGRVSTIEATLSTSGTAFSASVFAPMIDSDWSDGLTNNSEALPTITQVAAYVSAQVTNLSLGTAAQADVLVLGEGSTIADAFSSSDLVTASQVVAYVEDNRVTSLNANAIVYSKTDDTTGITSDLTDVNTAIEYLDAAVVSLSTSLDTALSAINTKASAGTASTSSRGVTFSVTFSSNAAPSMSVTGLGAAASMAVTPSIGPSQSTAASGTEGEPGYAPAVPSASNDNLATEKAVRDAIDAAIAAATLEWITDDPEPEPEPEP